MLERVPYLSAEALELGRYSDDFQENFWAVHASWKLERQETFREPGVQSWVAMARGDWPAAVRLIEEMRAGRAEHQRKLDEKGIVQRRVRIVTHPPTPYLQWEMNALRVFAELGEEIRVLPTAAVRGLEIARKLPEILVLGGESTAKPVMYEILYRDGVLAGARKFTDRYLVAECRREIADLWHAGEDLLSYFNREIASLPPPVPQAV
jgi:hypothetical protein